MKQTVWLMLADRNAPDLFFAVSSVCNLARNSGVLFSSYFETRRNGQLFAESGSTIPGGHHFQDFNYLCAVADVKVIRYGNAYVFDSSIRNFGLEVIAEAERPAELYRQLLDYTGGTFQPETLYFGLNHPIRNGNGQEIRPEPYQYPEILNTAALAFSPSDGEAAKEFYAEGMAVRSCFCSPEENDSLQKLYPQLEIIDRIQPDDDWRSITLRIAERWKHKAKSVFFGDPDALFCRIPEEARRKSVALYAPAVHPAPKEIKVSSYIEGHSAAAEDTARLAREIGNPVLCGRQTLDGDILLWSRSGLCIQIVDPNRPAFPVIDEFPQVWTRTKDEDRDFFEDSISDATLRQWAHEGKRLTTLLWHSGEIAHNEAMINLLECAAINKVKMGIGVHAQRYETCPQLWELIRIPERLGGSMEFIEPLLYSGGLGIAAEINLPPESLGGLIREAKERIRRIAGDDAVPRGHYCFLDSDTETHLKYRSEIWDAIAEAGMRYNISACSPGRNRILAEKNGCLVLNQSCRVLESSSPFVRITTAEDVRQRSCPIYPGWMIATLDAPVIAFNPYIWRQGHRFMELLNTIKTGGNQINVKPSTIARYARILQEEGFLPPAGPLI